MSISVHLLYMILNVCMIIDSDTKKGAHISLMELFMCEWTVQTQWNWLLNGFINDVEIAALERVVFHSSISSLVSCISVRILLAVSSVILSLACDDLSCDVILNCLTVLECLSYSIDSIKTHALLFYSQGNACFEANFFLNFFLHTFKHWITHNSCRLKNTDGLHL